MCSYICRLCGSSHLKPYLTLKDRCQIFVCQNCTNASTYPIPEANYDDHPFFAHVQANEKRWRSYSQQIVRFIQQNYGSTGRLLDVGCSHGLLLEEAGKVGFDVQGIEPSHSAVQHCQDRGLNVHWGYLTKNIFERQSFDVVIMSHVIEHVIKPVNLLAIARDLLTPQGVLCLCQTNYEGTLPRYLGRYWSYWVQHEHYYHFSISGIHHLLQNAGLQVISKKLLPLGYHLNFRIKSLRQVPSIALNTINFGVSRLQLGFPFRGDQMYILARPSDIRGPR